jgi:hypothetical protein
MAITRAQIARELYKDGKRVGLKGGADASTVGFDKSYDSREGTKGRSRSVNISPTGNVTTSSDRPDAPKTYIGGKEYDVLDTNIKERQEAEEVALARRQQAIDDFVNAPPRQINTPFSIMTTGLNAAQKFLPYKLGRRFYADKVEGRTVTLPDGRTVTFSLDNYDEYDDLRKQGIINPYGRVLTDFERGIGRDDGPDQPIIPLLQDPLTMDQATEELIEEEEPFELARRFRADGGIMNDDIIGGMMDGNMDEMGRQMYGLGKLVKKVTRGVKKIVKSPLGKAAIAGYFLGGGSLGGILKSRPGFSFANLGSSLGLGTLSGGEENIFTGGPFSNVANIVRDKLTSTGGKFMAGATLASVLPFFGLGTGDETEEEAKRILDNSGISPEEFNRLRNDIDYQNQILNRRSRAGGGIMRLGYEEGGDAEPVAKKTMPLIDMGGKEKDYRETGGFVDMGRMERADDVPARLSKNEFVFTADAVRNAGDGDIDKGAEVMYNMMKNLENGGDVSEESQGLEGARKMFQTSQRLEEVL